jgi:hypothetical protein
VNGGDLGDAAAAEDRSRSIGPIASRCDTPAAGLARAAGWRDKRRTEGPKRNPWCNTGCAAAPKLNIFRVAKTAFPFLGVETWSQLKPLV